MVHLEKYDCFVDRDGVVYRLDKTGKLWQPKIDKTPNGYARVRINGKTLFLHRLIAEAYIPNPENKREVDHKDRNRLNNSIENLRWMSRKENQLNTARTDACIAKYGMNSVDDPNAYQREKIKQNPEKYREYRHRAYLRWRSKHEH